MLAPPICCCWKGRLRYYEDVKKNLDGSDIIAEIYPEPGDPLVEKFGYGAFHNTNLEDLPEATLKNFAMKFGWVSAAQEVMDAIGPKK